MRVPSLSGVLIQVVSIHEPSLIRMRSRCQHFGGLRASSRASLRLGRIGMKFRDHDPAPHLFQRPTKGSLEAPIDERQPPRLVEEYDHDRNPVEDRLQDLLARKQLRRRLVRLRVMSSDTQTPPTDLPCVILDGRIGHMRQENRSVLPLNSTFPFPVADALASEPTLPLPCRARSRARSRPGSICRELRVPATDKESRQTGSRE